MAEQSSTATGFLPENSAPYLAEDLPYNINDPGDNRKFTNIITRWLDDADAIHRKYWNEWNEADDRLNGDITPVGFTTDHSEELRRDNDPTARMQEVKEYVSVNRTRPNHESIMGDFAAIRKKLSVQGRQPQMRSLAKVFAERVKYIEDVEMLPERIYFPTMDNAFSKGLHWIKVGYNPTGNKLRGKFEITDVNVRDVLVDPHCKGAYFQKAQYVIQRIQYSKEQASQKFSKYPLFDPAKVATDNDYNLPYNRSDDSNFYDDFGTFYEIQFTKPMQTYYLGRPDSNDIIELTRNEYQALSVNPTYHEFVFEGEMEEKHYIAFYNRYMGVYHLQKNDLDMRTLIPLLNIQTDSRLYGIGDVRNYSQLQDLLDVLVTVFLDNAKKSNLPIISADPEVMEEYQSELEHAVKHGGIAPGARQVSYPAPINAALTQLVPWVIGWIQDASSKHAASMGELPARQVAKETVQALIAKDRQSHGRKDVMLRYTLTELAKAIVKIVNLMEDEPDFFNAIDPKPEGLEHIPINQEWSEQEYLAQLSELYRLDVPKDPNQEVQYLQQLMKLKNKFEDENDVRVSTIDGFIIQGQEFSPKKLRELVNHSGLSLEDFTTLYKPQGSKIKMYKVNDLTQDIDFKVRYVIDEDYDDEPQFRANRALMLNARHAMSTLDMLKEMGINNAEQISENADKENQALQIAKTISADPNLMQAVQMLVQNPEAVQGMMEAISRVNNRKKPAGKEKKEPAEANA